MNELLLTFDLMGQLLFSFSERVRQIQEKLEEFVAALHAESWALCNVVLSFLIVIEIP